MTLAAAFLVVKRAKEVFWIAVGYSLFLLPTPGWGAARPSGRPRALADDERRADALLIPA
jgi:hypothetical protein